MAANLLYPEAITSSPLNPQSLEKVQALISEGDSAIDILESLFAAMQLLSLNFEHEAGRITRAVDCINDFSGYLTKTMASFSDISVKLFYSCIFVWYTDFFVCCLFSLS